MRDALCTAWVARLDQHALPSSSGFTVHCDPLPVVFSWQPSLGRQEEAKFHYEVQLSMAGDGREYRQVSPVTPFDPVSLHTDDVM